MSDAVIIERTVEAPPEVVWSLWTDPVHFAAWYGPDGATITVLAMDVVVGGSRHIGMAMGEHRMWFAGEHLEVVEPRRLIYTEAVADEQGALLSPPTEVRLELSGSDGRTTLVLTHVGVAPGSPGAVGWAMALDKLEARASA